MRYPPEWYQMVKTIATYFPNLRAAQQRGLALWVYGTILAHSACQNAVVTALLTLGSWHTLRQHLREWLYDGADKAAPCQTQVDVSLCFAPLPRWLLAWWQGTHLAIAIDATAHGDEVVAIVVSVLYRGSAIPIAWHMLPANKPGVWMVHILRLLRLLWRVVPANMQVIVLADRGLWSPRLWKRIRDVHWHPLLRLQEATYVRPMGGRYVPASHLVPGPGHAWVGQAVVFKGPSRRRAGTLLVVWEEGQEGPWVLLTDLPIQEIGVCWYGLRIWIELGFRALKGIGWQWQNTRRREAKRVARHWLVLAIATLWVLAYGTRVEDAELQGKPPARLRTPPDNATRRFFPASRHRLVSLFRLGLAWLAARLPHGRVWRCLWLAPEPWPEPPSRLQIVYHDSS